jgi:NDP-sugar pyrophosphorylase family protein
LRAHGIEDIVLSCSYMVEEVERTMGHGRDYGVRLRYAVETEPLGTGGGVRNAADLLSDVVVVLNGDVLTDVDLGAMLAFHRARGAAATIYLTRVPDPTAYGLVDLDPTGRIQRFLEKPDPGQVTTDTINAGAYILDRALLARIPVDRPVSIEREFFPGLLADALPFYGWVGEHYWLDIGSPAKYRQAQLDLLARRVAMRLPPEVLPADATSGDGEISVAATASIEAPALVGRGSRVEADARVGPWTVLGERCWIGPGARVERAVLWDGVTVGARAVLSECVVGADVSIGAGARVGAGVVLASGAVVAPGEAVDG